MPSIVKDCNTALFTICKEDIVECMYNLQLAKYISFEDIKV